MKYYVYTTDEGTLIFTECLLPEKKCLGSLRADKETIANMRRVEGANYAHLKGIRTIIRGG